MDKQVMSFPEFYQRITQSEDEMVEFRLTTYKTIDEHYIIKLDGTKLMFLTRMQSVECLVAEYDFATGTGYYYY